MKAIILSAGKGDRLFPLTKDRPKIIIELGDGTTMLSRQYDNFCNQNSINEIVIASGHCVQKVEEYMSRLNGDLLTSVVYNPFYSMSGPLVTLWVALNKVSDSDFLFLNGDTIFTQAVHSRINDLSASGSEGIYLFCSYKDDFSTDDVKLRITENNIVEAGKNIESGNAISAGLMMIKGEEVSRLFRETLEAVARREDFLNYNKTWHSFINDLASAGIKVEPVLINTTDWIEVDLHFELEELQKILAGKLHLDV
jgi:choline kinase